jgi:hypothetical protein
MKIGREVCPVSWAGPMQEPALHIDARVSAVREDIVEQPGRGAASNIPT